MSFWITGAKGFIGGHLARELAHAGHSVDGIGHGALQEIDWQRLGLRSWVNGEIDSANLDMLAARHGLPTMVFHLAGGSSVGQALAQPLEDFSRTVASTARLLEWLRVHSPDSRVIAVSSAAVYGSNHPGPITEEAALTPISPYGQHKLMMEQLCRSYANVFGVRSMVVRLFSVYGPNLRKQLLWDICSRLGQGERVLTLGGTGAEVRDWCDVRDVVRLLAMLGTAPQERAFQVINGGSGRPIRVADIAQMLVGHWDRATVQFSGIERRGDPFSLLADDTSLRGVGFEWRIAATQGIADYVKWFREHIRA